MAGRLEREKKGGNGLKQFYDINDLKEITGRSDAYCYKIVRILNEELEKAGFLTLRARVPVEYFQKRFGAGGGAA